VAWRRTRPGGHRRRSRRRGLRDGDNTALDAKVPIDRNGQPRRALVCDGSTSGLAVTHVLHQTRRTPAERSTAGPEDLPRESSSVVPTRSQARERESVAKAVIQRVRIVVTSWACRGTEGRGPWDGLNSVQGRGAYCAERGVVERAAELLRAWWHPGCAAGREACVGREPGASGGRGDGTALLEPLGVVSKDGLPGGGRLVVARQAEALTLGNSPHQVDERRADGRLDAAHSSRDDDGLDVRPSNGAPDSSTVASIARSSHGATRVHTSARAVRTPSAGVRPR